MRPCAWESLNLDACNRVNKHDSKIQPEIEDVAELLVRRVLPLRAFHTFVLAKPLVATPSL